MVPRIASHRVASRRVAPMGKGNAVKSKAKAKSLEGSSRPAGNPDVDVDGGMVLKKSSFGQIRNKVKRKEVYTKIKQAKKAAKLERRQKRKRESEALGVSKN